VPRALLASALIAASLVAMPAAAALVGAEPLTPIVAPFPAGAPPVETQVVLQVVVDAGGAVESAVELSRAPRAAPDTFAAAAIATVEATRFSPSTRDGQPIRARIEYVVVFHPPPRVEAAPPPRAIPAEAAPLSVYVEGFAKPSPRGLGDVRIDRELLNAAPHQQTSEMLSAAPGFFVDHEDGEGLGNDVYLRGFDLDNGSGIEMKVGGVPINVPMHIHGQGYADVNFIIPEVVSGVRVLEGSYDPRQGDAAIVGSASFDLGVAERGYQLKTSYGSFNQARVLGIVAPREANQETFAAFALRETQGFGQSRASQSGSINAQYGLDLGSGDHLRILATGYAARAALPGVVRQDDVSAGRIGYYGAYPYFNASFPSGCSSASCSQPAQGVQTARVLVGAELDHVTAGGAHVDVAPWVMWTDFRSRQNYTGDLNSSNLQPQLASLGDLWQLTNNEIAAGVGASFRSATVHFGEAVELVIEPGVSLRGGHTDQSKSLLNPANLEPWDDRQSYGLDALDLGGYLDLDLRLWKRLRIAGGARADFLAVSITDKLSGVVPPIANGALAGSLTDVTGVAPGPRVTASFEIVSGIAIVASAGEGFRSLDAGSLTSCNAATVPLTGLPSTQRAPCKPGSPYSQVLSFEGGFRADVGKGRFTTTLAAFQTNVANELVFEAASGGLTTEAASVRRGLSGSFVAKPVPWLLASTALSIQRATFDTLVVGASHLVPNVPAVLWRADVNAHGELFRAFGEGVSGRAGVGYTLLGGRHVNDRIVAPTNNVLNALAAVRYRLVELGVDMYNVLGLTYADDEQVYVSNWSLKPGQQPASNAVHLVAAPPRTALGTLRLYL
jgi:hypothetical protein